MLDLELFFGIVPKSAVVPRDESKRRSSVRPQPPVKPPTVEKCASADADTARRGGTQNVAATISDEDNGNLPPPVPDADVPMLSTDDADDAPMPYAGNEDDAPMPPVDDDNDAPMPSSVDEGNAVVPSAIGDDALRSGGSSMNPNLVEVSRAASSSAEADGISTTVGNGERHDGVAGTIADNDVRCSEADTPARNTRFRTALANATGNGDSNGNGNACHSASTPRRCMTLFTTRLWTLRARTLTKRKRLKYAVHASNADWQVRLAVRLAAL